MNITFPVIELLDRLCIAQIKFEITGANAVELDYYETQAKNLDLELVKSHLGQLKTIHREIWQLEKELKSGREEELSLEEIGRRAIKIRDKNNQRVVLKNQMAEILDCNVREIKKDHLSE
jgi:hypothetical protein